MKEAVFKFPGRFFITGTDTGVGKTVVSAILQAGLGSFYWKPVQSGLSEKTDTELVREMSGLADRFFWPEAYRLKAPISPHASAASEGITIDPARIRLPVWAHGPLIVEGAGGILVPLNASFMMLDLMKDLALPVLLVARSGLGTINHTLLSLEVLRSNGLRVFGIVMNGTLNESNRQALEFYGKTEVLAELSPLPELSPATIRQAFKHFF